MYNVHANRQMPHEYKRTFQSENNKENPKIENSNVQMLTTKVQTCLQPEIRGCHVLQDYTALQTKHH